MPDLDIIRHGGSGLNRSHESSSRQGSERRRASYMTTAARRAAPMASYQIAPPESFNFSQPDGWPKWIRRFERFRQASGLDTKGEPSQVNTLIYTMGDEADDLHDLQMKVYDKVKAKFDSHFVKRRNLIYERAKFNQRRQEEGESVDAFVTSLYCLAEHCGYGSLHSEMIRDRIVVGLQDASLSERLQMDPELTLDKAIFTARQSEAVKK